MTGGRATTAGVVRVLRTPDDATPKDDPHAYDERLGILTPYLFKEV